MTRSPQARPDTFDRARNLARLSTESFDVVVIGGGITGAGVALDAASRGLRVAMVERDDFASGTSSRSSKLVHGGLRYLQQKEFGLVYEALAERQRLLDNAPHLVSVLPFLIPLFGRDGVVNRSVAKAYSTALWLYDMTGGVRIGKRHRRISRDEALELWPTLPADRLVAAFLYFDAHADDARLTMTVARTAAVRYGAAVVNHAAVVGLGPDDGPVRTVTVEADGRRIDIDTQTVVNAAGVWSDQVQSLATHDDQHTIRPAKGIHITVPWDRIRNEVAGAVPVPGDKRSVFVVRWGDHTYIGTTDTDHDGSIDDPQCSPEDVDYLIDAINGSLTEPISRDDVVGTWAGLRPLVASARTDKTADLSRRHKVRVGERGVISVTGGKLTTYRKMAVDTVDVVVRSLGRSPRRRWRSRTADLALVGAADPEVIAAELTQGGMSPEKAEHLARRHGDGARVIAGMIDADPTLANPVVEGLPYLEAEVVHAVRYEMATTISDVADRRLRARLLDQAATARAADRIAELVGAELGWSSDERRRAVEEYRAALAAERSAPGLDDLLSA